jgi:hypothetical protein
MEIVMPDETNVATAAPTTSETEPAAPATEPAVETAGQASSETGADTPEETISETEPSQAASKESALNNFVANASHVELLASIEEGAGYVLKMIEAIPEGVAHGWHSLAAEIRSRI